MIHKTPFAYVYISLLYNDQDPADSVCWWQHVLDLADLFSSNVLYVIYNSTSTERPRFRLSVARDL